MLPKRHRPIERRECVELKMKKTENARPKIVFLVRKKVAKKAVARNKIKRQLRAAMRSYALGIRGGVDLLVIANESILEKSFLEIKNELRALLRKRKLFI